MSAPVVAARRRWAPAVACAFVLAAVGLLVPPAHAQSGPARTTPTTTPATGVDAGDDPCGLLTAAEVETAVGIVDPDQPGPYGSSTNQCIYGEPLGLHFRITSNVTGDGGKFAKETCARAKAGTTPYADYARVRGAGKLACSYTMDTDPTLLVVALYRGSKSVGRALTLAVSGTPEQLAPLEARIDAGLLTLAQRAADAVKRKTD